VQDFMRPIFTLSGGFSKSEWAGKAPNRHPRLTVDEADGDASNATGGEAECLTQEATPGGTVPLLDSAPGSL
jgi:hypothetical protein